MEANELYNLSISPLVTTPFAIEWSNDNHMSLITLRGVHVFELVPHPMCIYPTLKLWRTFVYPSEFLPAAIFEKFVNTEIWKMKREEIYRLLMQDAITPKIEEKTDLIPRIVKVAWSPVKLVDPSKCLLTIVTSAGSVELLYKLGGNWFSVWNLTVQWSKIVGLESGVDPDNLTENSFDKISWPEHIKRFLGTTVAWSPLSDDFRTESTFAFLAVAFRSSDVVIYKIRRISDVDRAKEPEIVYKTCLKSSIKISELFWLSLDEKKHVIVIGYADGRICGLRVDESDGILKENRLIEYQGEADRMPISCIKFMYKSEGKRIIVTTKTSFLLALSIDNEGECIETRHIRVAGYSITGLIIVGKVKAIVTTQDGRMYAVTIKNGEELTGERVNHDLKNSKVQYLGLGSSPSGAILVNATSPDSMYDHLLNREPSGLQLFTLAGDEYNPWRILNDKENANASLYGLWDCLESIRITASKSLEPDKLLPEIPKDLDGLSIDRLRIVMWLTLISQVLDKKQLLKGVDKIVGEISEAQPLIFIRSACKRLNRLAKKLTLTPEEKKSVNFLRMYVEIYLAGEDDEDVENNRVCRLVVEALEATSHLAGVEPETCNLCGEIFTELPWTIENCPSGHKLPRCSVTLLQITSIRYRTCPVCGRIFHPSLDYENEETRCIYCDVPAQYDSRIKSTNLEDVELRCKNLSKRPISYFQETSRHQDDQVPPESPAAGKTKRWKINPHTFAVIVNKDDDDSFITETWQEF